MSQLSPVAFHGDTIYCVEHNGEPFAPLRPIIDNMGVDWGTQFRKLNDNKERWTVVIMTTVAADGCERETLCIPVRKLPAFLASINARKVRPELREKLIRYQNECDDALWAYWTQKHQQKAQASLPSVTELPKRKMPSAEQQIEKALRDALAKLDFAYKLQGLHGANFMMCSGDERHMKYLQISCMSNINAAAAIVRTMLDLRHR